jgi:ferredoxin-NADP reductase
VARIFDETPDVKTFRLVSPDGGPLPFTHRPGQYLNLRLEVDGRRVSRSYTIASPPGRRDACEISVRRVDAGRASNRLHDGVAEGDRLRVSAPAGRFVFTGEEADRVVLIAGGVGITPAMSVVRHLTDRAWPGRIDLVLSFRTRADVVFADELAWLGRRFPNLHVAIVLTREPGTAGRLTAERLAEFVPDLAAAPRVMLCGPDAMMAAVRTMLRELGVPPDRIATEEFVSPPDADDAAPVADPDADPDAAAMVAADIATVRFLRSDRVIEAEPGTTLLEAAENAGVAIPFECRSGICGQCRTRLASGRVAMDAEDALTSADRDRGLILMCQAHPVGDVTVDA